MPKVHFKTSSGTPFPFGPSYYPEGINFAVFSRHATSATLVLKLLEKSTGPEGIYEIPLNPEIHRTGDIWHIFLHCQDSRITYGYRFDGNKDDAKGIIFSPDRILIDPYAKKILPRVWGAKSCYGIAPVCIAEPEIPFDWQGDKPLKIPAADAVIYELHTRGFTRHRSSSVDAPGTFLAIIQKIPYLKKLGITSIELLPITEWDETDNHFYSPETGELLYNFWGYNPISFMALKSGLAADPHNCLNEFKLMVRSLHEAGIEVILDMVFNHTGEIGYDGKTTSFRGIDNSIYYILDQSNGSYLNFSGCGNTLNCNHPVVCNLILDALHYWTLEMHVDGFRFDLASIFSRDTTGQATDNPPLVDRIAQDPLLRDTKIIAEAWDATGLYQVGSFSKDKRWAEWNGRFRDDVRMFMKGQKGTTQTLATRIAGSSDLYQNNNRGPLNSINFLTCHDGFTLHDLVSYNKKVNHANGEKNRDGDNHNLSWNSGYEGIPCSAETETLRRRRIRTFFALLLVSQGLPMIYAGDEFGRSQLGNNNSWCQDNDLGWVDWSLEKENSGLLRFCQKCIALRQSSRVFRRTGFFTAPTDHNPTIEVSWQSLIPGEQDWSEECHTLGFLLHKDGGTKDEGNDFFIMVNGDRTRKAVFTIPEIPDAEGNQSWRKIVDTSASSPGDIVDYEKATEIIALSKKTVLPMALIILQTKAAGSGAK